MSQPGKAPPILAPARSQARTLRRLFLTLFLRGRSSRGLTHQKAPRSVGSKLAVTLLLYALVGLAALAFMNGKVLALSLYLHGLTFVLVGMYVAVSAGEVLFNQQEADILLHRPVTTRAILWAKIAVLVQVSLWLAGAFNFAGFFAGMSATDGDWRFPIVHAVSTALESLFCASGVVLIYQLCLRWFGRERLDGLMTMAQMLVAVGAVLAGQLAPRLMSRLGGDFGGQLKSWWIFLLPPAWYAGIDDALAGSGSQQAWTLGTMGLAATLTVIWLAFGKLARDYERGVRLLLETASPSRKKKSGRRWMDILLGTAPMRWWLRDSVSRAAFKLVAAYLVRDRDVKLRVYPGLAPILAMPLVFILQSHGSEGKVTGSGFSTAFAGAYLGLVPLLATQFLCYSQQWAAADLFRVAPLTRPAKLAHGMRAAVLIFLTVPVLLMFMLITGLWHNSFSEFPLLLPGIISLPVYSLVPCLNGKAVPFSLPTEEAKSAGRGLTMIIVMFVSFAMAGLAAWAWSSGWFQWFLLAEVVGSTVLYFLFRQRLNTAPWAPLE